LIHDVLENEIYDSICMPIANAKWAERWRSMCMSSESSRAPDGAAIRRSQHEKATQKDPPFDRSSDPTRDSALQTSAEAWRAGTSGRFQRDEVNLTKIGL
jgi:hypothetical protein